MSKRSTRIALLVFVLVPLLYVCVGLIGRSIIQRREDQQRAAVEALQQKVQVFLAAVIEKARNAADEKRRAILDNCLKPDVEEVRANEDAPAVSEQRELENADAWKEIAAWRAPMPKARVISGCELMIDGVPCRLFGVKLPEDAVRAASAKRFLERYMETFGDYFSIYNTNAPVCSKDGVPLIWLLGHSNGGWAQEALVQAGLIDVDYTGFEDYKFSLPGKENDDDFDWKKCLSDAVSWHRAGKPAEVQILFK